MLKAGFDPEFFYHKGGTKLNIGSFVVNSCSWILYYKIFRVLNGSCKMITAFSTWICLSLSLLVESLYLQQFFYFFFRLHNDMKHNFSHHVKWQNNAKERNFKILKFIMSAYTVDNVSWWVGGAHF